MKDWKAEYERELRALEQRDQDLVSKDEKARIAVTTLYLELQANFGDEIEALNESIFYHEDWNCIYSSFMDKICFDAEKAKFYLSDKKEVFSNREYFDSREAFIRHFIKRWAAVAYAKRR